MSANDIIQIVDNIPKYLVYVYPGYITIYLYYFFRGITVKETKGILLKAIILSYIYISVLSKFTNFMKLSKCIDVQSFPNVGIGICLMAVSVAYLAYRLVISDTAISYLEKLKIHTTFSMNELEEIEKDCVDGTWLCVYLKDSNIAYEGFLSKKEMELDRKQYIVICGYRKYAIGDDGKSVKPYIYDYDDNQNEKVIIYFDEIKRFEIRDNTITDEDDEIGENQESE